MDRVFSRRSFLKCSALTAVAFAGAGLLSGCDAAEHPVQTALNTTNTALRVDSTLESAEYVDGTLKFRFKVYNGRVNDIGLTRFNFCVKSNSFYTYAEKDKLSVKFVQTEDSVIDAQIKTGFTAVVDLTIPNFPELKEGEKVTLIYYPDTQYMKLASASWILDRSVLVPAQEEGTPVTPEH